MSSKQLITTTILLLLLIQLATAKNVRSTQEGITIQAPEITICTNEACTVTYNICNQNNREKQYQPTITTKLTIKNILDNNDEIPFTKDNHDNKATTQTLQENTCKVYTINVKPFYGATTKYDINWLDPFITTLLYQSNFTADKNSSLTNTNTSDDNGLRAQGQLNYTNTTVYSIDYQANFVDALNYYPYDYIERTTALIRATDASIAAYHRTRYYYNDSTTQYGNEYSTTELTYQQVEIQNPVPEKKVDRIAVQYKQSASSTKDIYLTNFTSYTFNTSSNNYTSTTLAAASTIEYIKLNTTLNHNTTTSDYTVRFSCNNGTNWTNNLQEDTVTACPVTGTGLIYNVVLNTTSKPYTTIDVLQLDIIKGRMTLNFDIATSGEIHWVGGGTNFTNTTTVNTTLYNAEEGFVTVTFNKNTYNEYQQEYTTYYDGNTDVNATIKIENATTARPIRTFITGSTTPASTVKVTLKKIIDGTTRITQQVYTNTYGEGSILVIPGSAYNYEIAKDGYTTGTGTLSVGYATDAIVFSIAQTTSTITTATYATNLTQNQRSNQTNYVAILSSANNYDVNINVTICDDGTCSEYNNDYTTDEGARTDFTVANGTDTVQVKITIDGTLRINEIYTMRDSINQTTTTTEDTEGISPGDETTWELNPFQGIIIITITSIIAGLWMESKRKGWGLWTTIISISIFGYIYPILWLITGGFGALFTYQLFRKTINGE